MGDQMRYKHARNALAAATVATLVAIIEPGTAEARPAITTAEPTAGWVSSGEKDVVLTFYDARGLPILMRQGFWNGTTGYGWEKIQRKHLIVNKRVVQGIIQNPNGGEFDPKRAKRKLYKAIARQDECVVGVGCRPVQSIRMIAVVDFSESKRFPKEVVGVITAYCKTLQGDEWPAWVNRISRFEY